MWLIYLVILGGGALSIMHENVKSPPNTKRVLKEAGYTEVTLTGYKPWACGSDSISQGFTGKNRDGYQISGVVCSGLIAKATTIRTN
jgi:hypothetical protein